MIHEQNNEDKNMNIHTKLTSIEETITQISPLSAHACYILTLKSIPYLLLAKLSVKPQLNRNLFFKTSGFIYFQVHISSSG